MAHAEAVVKALREAHPYEEPAFNLQRLAAPPSGLGFGRFGSVEAAPARVHVGRLKRSLGLDHVLVGGPLDREVTRAAVCAGSGGDLVGDAIASSASLVTGELRHHDALRAIAHGLVVVCVRHSTSERGALVPLAQRPVRAVAGRHRDRERPNRDPFVFA